MLLSSAALLFISAVFVVCFAAVVCFAVVCFLMFCFVDVVCVCVVFVLCFNVVLRHVSLVKFVSFCVVKLLDINITGHNSQMSDRRITMSYR